MTPPDSLEKARESFAKRLWADAYAQFCEADTDRSLEAADLERLALVADLLGKDQESADAWSRAHHVSLENGDLSGAARSAFWLGFALRSKGDFAPSRGWLARAQTVLNDSGEDCPEIGFLILATALQTLEEGDAGGAFPLFVQAAEIGERFNNTDLKTLSMLGRGVSLVHQGRAPEGLRLLDEAMVAVASEEVSPLVVGIVYCASIQACQAIFDMRRSQEWTAALSRWCDSQPDMVPFRGECLLHRAELLQLRGEWQDATQEAQRACDLLSKSQFPETTGSAFYQQGELHRLRGEFGKAEESYRLASRWGRKPDPGLAQLRLAQGHLDTAEATIRRALNEPQDNGTRSRLLTAFVEIMVASGDVDAASEAASELSRLAGDFDAPYLNAVSAQASGTVLLAKHDARAALNVLRHAWSAWQELSAPYEAGRVRVLVGQACQALGDEDTAQMEFDAARWIFSQLGAATDLAHLERLTSSPAGRSSGLTEREIDVLRLVATGSTNRAIATDLFISEKTVARHVSNIFTKLGLSSRSAATAYAFEHGLVSTTT